MLLCAKVTSVLGEANLLSFNTVYTISFLFVCQLFYLKYSQKYFCLSYSSATQLQSGYTLKFA